MRTRRRSRYSPRQALIRAVSIRTRFRVRSGVRLDHLVDGCLAQHLSPLPSSGRQHELLELGDIARGCIDPCFRNRTPRAYAQPCIGSAWSSVPHLNETALHTLITRWDPRPMGLLGVE